MQPFSQGQGAHRRSGVAIVLVVVCLVVLFAFAALTVDVAVMYNTRSDLQRSADAAALAAAEQLANYGGENPLERARYAAKEYVERNGALGLAKLSIDPNSDVIFGNANIDTVAHALDFVPVNVFPDSVRVRVRCTKDSGNGPVGLLFARVFGKHAAEVSAVATAAMTPRDIALVADLSGSMSDDSELRQYRKTEINLWDIWEALPGGIDDAPECAGVSCTSGTVCSGGSCVPVGAGAQSGPAWGYFDKLGFGTAQVDSSYDPTTDPGLIRLAYNTSWTDASLRADLSARGYSTSEVNAIMAPTNDSTSYRYRVAVALGLADWKSGMSGGLWALTGLPASLAGNGNGQVDSGELTWVEGIFGLTPSSAATVWVDYINSYMRSTSTAMAAANSAFQYRFGIKTFVNYLMEKRGSFSQTPELAGTPAQPMQAVKDAASYLSDLLYRLESTDQVSLEVYATTGRHEIDLTSDFLEVSDRLKAMQAGYYDSSTNMGGGLERAIEELTSSRARSFSHKVILLLTDGIANVGADGRANDVSGGGSYALAQAQRAADLGIRIMAVSVGAESDQTIMQKIAEVGRGRHFHAEGTVEEYSAELAKIFVHIGTTRSVELIE